MIGKITFLSGIYQGKSFYFKNILTLGRNPSNDIQLPFPSVSREHARLSVSGKQGSIKDLKSNNGTFLNGKIVADKMNLQNGDIIRISNFEMKFEILDDNAVDDKKFEKKGKNLYSSPKDTATGFINIQDINLSNIEKQIRE